MSETKQLPSRSQMDAAFTWDLTPLYPADAAWEADFALVAPLLEQAAEFDGALGQGWEQLLACLLWQEKLGRLLEKLSLYAFLRRDEDTGAPVAQSLYQRVEALLVEASTKLAFFSPQLLALPEEQMTAYLNRPELALYRQMLTDILRERPHLRTPEEEKLLAGVGELAGAFDNIYTMLTEADLSLPVITNEQGEQERLTLGNYSRLLRCRERSVRQGAYDGLHQAFSAYGNTIAATYAASVKKDNFFAAAHHYPSALSASLFEDDVPEEVYRNLIQQVRAGIPALSAYLRRRKQLLGLDKLRMFDVYVPLFPELPMTFHWQQARELVLAALAPLGAEYQARLRAGLDSRWVDVYENQGKGSGAYSASCYDSPPYILMNFQDDINSLFTLAHEAGHSMHSLYTRENQPYVYGDYRIFVAEVASTVNENLLMDYLLAHAENKQEMNYLVNHYVEEFRGTVYQQAMFSEFELAAHEQAAAGQPLTAESLCAIYGGLLRDYFGAEVELTEADSWGWARVPHFYRAYYVYKYATGFSAASALALGLVDADGDKAAANRRRYLNFLSAGCTQHPLELLSAAGVDLRSPEPVQRGLALFAQLSSQL